jgi:hypothetical protein
MTMSDLGLPDIERPAFFDGQRLTAADLAQAQAFSRDLRWLHNRSLHGWGIVFGLAVAGDKGAARVAVAAGYALDCAGRDLILEDPVALEIPAVSGPASFQLTISYAPDEALDADEREGVCGRRGAVRLVDEPVLRWQDPLTSDPEGVVRPGLDVVLATVTVERCKLAQAASGTARRELPRPSPYVAGGATPPGGTPWRLWPSAAAPYGVATTVSTAAAGFGSTPVYQARLAGERELGHSGAAGLPVVFDGYAHVVAPSATSFELNVLLPASTAGAWIVTGPGGDGAVLNPAEMIDAALPGVLRDELRWHVAWMGVEP